MTDDTSSSATHETDKPGQPAAAQVSHVYQYVHHRRHGAAAPVKVVDQHKQDTAVSRFNAKFAVMITNAIGSMWCAYIFAAIAFIGLPGAIKEGTLGIVQWIAQTFLQLVLLSIIIVGQNVQAAASDKRAECTYEDAEAVLHEALQIQAHLLAQDEILEKLVATMRVPPPAPASGA